MITDVIMPKLGQTMEEGKIERWLKKEGDRVAKGDVLLEITTDKATLEVESYGSGIIKKILAGEGETIPVTNVIAYIGEEADELPPLSQEKTEGPPQEEKAGAPVAPMGETSGETGSRILASPLAKRLAREKGIDLSQIKGTGPGGRVTKEDVEAIKAPLSSMREAVARQMSLSKTTIPHFYRTVEVDASSIIEQREKLLPEIEALTSKRLTLSHLIIKATALALAKFPSLNSTWGESEVKRYENINIGLAISLDEGLIVPVIKDADKKEIRQIVTEASDIIEKAKNNKLSVEDCSGGTFTFTNLGMFGVDSFYPIINPPQAGILGVGQIKQRPVAIDGQILIRPVMKLTLSIDHRLVDGVDGSRFLAECRQILEAGQEPA